MAEAPAYSDDISPIYSLAAYQILHDNLVSSKLPAMQRAIIDEQEFALNLSISTVLPGVTMISTGSVAEGLSNIYMMCGDHADMDFLEVRDSLKAIENVKDIDHTGNLTEYLIESDDRYPGFVKLVLVKEGFDLTSIGLQLRTSIYSVKNGRKYLPSSELKIHSKLTLLNTTICNIFNTVNVLDFIQIMGPAITLNTRNATLGCRNGFSVGNIDSVFAIPCPSWPNVALEWVRRIRYNNWPPTDVIQAIVQKGSYLVPNGMSDSPSVNLEWAFTFSHVEPLLVKSLNDIAIKTYGALKLLERHIFGEEHGDILSSYVWKTAVFWEVEESPVETYVLHKLLYCVRNCLIRVQTWLHSNFAPHYFIRSQNLFRKKIEPGVRERNLESLGALIENIQVIFVKLPPFLHVLSKNTLHEVVDSYDSSSTLTIDTLVSSTFMKRAIFHYLFTPFLAFASFVIGESFSEFTSLTTEQLESLKEKVKSLCRQRRGSPFKLLLCSIFIIKKLTLELFLSLNASNPKSNKGMYHCRKLLHCTQKSLKSTEPTIVLGNLMQFMVQLVILNDHERFEMCIQIIQNYLMQYPRIGYSASDLNNFVSNFLFGFFCSSAAIETNCTSILVNDVHLTKHELGILPPALGLELECRLHTNHDRDPCLRTPNDFVVSLDSEVLFYFLSFYFYHMKDKNMDKITFLHKLEESCKRPLTSTRHIAWNLLGYCQSRMGMYEDAFKSYLKSLAFQYNKPDLRTSSKATPWHVAILLNKCLWNEWSKTT